MFAHVHNACVCVCVCAARVDKHFFKTNCYRKKHIYGGARQAILQSLDSAVSSLLALISREYAQLVYRTTGLYTEGAPEH